MIPSDHIKSLLIQLPSQPGVYQYFDKAGKILYVGKAKNLKNRVRSYFTGKNFGKTRILVGKIVDIRIIIVENEQEALLLENSLIKKHQPPYNIQLKDDKTFPWLAIKNERFPRLVKTRNVLKDGSEYFGPYSNVRMMDNLQDLIHNLYPLRNCTLNLSEKNIKAQKFKVCLEYHLGNCLGPCENLESEETYSDKVAEIRGILKGNVFKLLENLRMKMEEFANALQFEKAHLVKEKIEQLEKYRSKYTVVNPRMENTDVFAYYETQGKSFVNFLRVINGAIVQGHTVEVKRKLDEDQKRVLEQVLANFHERFDGLSKAVILPWKMDLSVFGAKCIVPIKGDKKALFEMSLKNAKYYASEQALLQQPVKNHTLLELQEKLYLKELPLHIECFDNSNIQGTSPMSACVVFKNGKPSSKDYRLFNIMTVQGPNDFASMEEVVFRRYSRLLSEGEPLPQLLIVDGGKGQLSAAISSLKKLNLVGKIAVVGIAKRLEEIYFPNDSTPHYIDKKSAALKLIQHLRNEAHRFSLKGHRNQRSRKMTQSELDDIKGIGKLTAQKLLRHFGSIERMVAANQTEIEALVGVHKTQIILNYFKLGNGKKM